MQRWVGALSGRGTQGSCDVGDSDGCFTVRVHTQEGAAAADGMPLN